MVCDATASGLMDDLDGMMSGMNKRYNMLLDECHELAEMWAGLKRAGGARDDHAAELLKRLLLDVNKLHGYTSQVKGLLEGAIASPFGD